MLDGFSIPNGLAWSPDGRIMYFADTLAGAIDAFDYDLTDGITSNRRAFARTAGQPGGPDGATVDADGFLWSAQYDGGCVTRYTPDGRVNRRVALPVQRPTSCAFGGPRLDTLFVTTASQELSAAELAAQPLAGRVLALDAGVCGRSEPQFAA
jgi:sugar lactone lactonase YvrE